MPKNAKKIAYKEKEFRAYALWKSMPAYFRGMKKEQLQTHGFTDPLVLKMATIKNQTAFAKYFHIKDLGTLTDWNSKIKKNNLVVDTLNLAFKEEVAHVSKKINTQPDMGLRKKIYEQNKLIALLKKENITYKKRLEVLASRKPAMPPLPPPPEHKTISQKIKNAFWKWRGK